jgi:hypothetical protein
MQAAKGDSVACGREQDKVHKQCKRKLQIRMN